MSNWKQANLQEILKGYAIDRCDVCPWISYTRHVFRANTKLPSSIVCHMELGAEHDLRDTNNVHISRFPVPQVFVITSLHVTTTGSDHCKELFRHNYILEMTIGQKIYHQIPVEMIDSIAVVEEPVKGLQAQPGYFPQDYPLVILQAQCYKPTLIGRSFVVDEVGLSVLVALNGLLLRGVQ